MTNTQRQSLVEELAKNRAELRRLDIEKAELEKRISDMKGQSTQRISEILIIAPFSISRGAKWVPKDPYIQTMTPDTFNASVAEDILRKHTTVLFADEVADEVRDVLFATGNNDKSGDLDSLMDVPNVMLPFESLFVDARVSSNEVKPRSFNFGVQVTSQIRPLDFNHVEKFRTLGDLVHGRGCIADLRFSVYVQFGSGPVYGPVGHAFAAITSEYTLLKIDEEIRAVGDIDPDTIGRPLIVYSIGVPLPEWVERGQSSPGGMAQALIHCGASLATRAIGMLNCSNVEYIPEGPLHNPKVRKRRADLATIRYHVLKVRIGKTLHPVHTRNPSGVGVALHMVRGHFKDFSRGRGAFGREKLRKSLWCPSFVRGSSSHGVSLHDYEIDPTDTSNEEPK